MNATNYPDNSALNNGPTLADAPPAAWDTLAGRLIFGGLLTVIACAAIPYGAAQPWTEALVEFLIFVLGLLACAHGFVQRGETGLSDYRLLLPFAVLGLYIYLQSVALTAGGPVSYDPYGTRLVLYKLLALLVTLGLLLRYTNSTRRLGALVILVLGCAVGCALFGLARQTLQHSDGFGLPLLLVNGGYAQYINKNHFATFMLLGLGLLLGLLFGKGVPRERLLLVVALTLPLWAALILCGSRSGVLGLGAELVLVILLAPLAQEKNHAAPRSRWLSIAGSWAGRGVLVLALLGGGILSLVWLGGESAVSRFEKASDETILQTSDGTNANRFGIWRSTWQLFQTHPVTGVGFGGFWIAVSTVHQGSGRLIPQQAHNDYLEILASGGILGALLVLLCGGAVICAARRQLHAVQPLRRAIALGALTGVGGWAAQSLLEFGGHITFNALICTVLVALATVQLPVSPNDMPNRRARRAQ